MARRIEDYLGTPAFAMLIEQPFKEWSVRKDLDEEVESLTYSFEGQGLELRCDPHTDLISSIFVHCDGMGTASNLLEISCDMSREQVIRFLGQPEKSGEGRHDPILGDYGPWDRFSRETHSIHIEYRPESDRIKMVTFMRPDVVPGAAT